MRLWKQWWRKPAYEFTISSQRYMKPGNSHLGSKTSAQSTPKRVDDDKRGGRRGPGKTNKGSFPSPFIQIIWVKLPHLLLGGSAPCLQHIFILDGHTFIEGFVDTRLIHNTRVEMKLTEFFLKQNIISSTVSQGLNALSLDLPNVLALLHLSSAPYIQAIVAVSNLHPASIGR